MAPADKTVGRTPWDVASEVLTRLGPTAIVVVGFLAFTFFLYIQIKEESKEENKLLIASLKDAQNQIVNNTKKMGEMSEKMIKNINSILTLRDTVDKNATAQKNKFDAHLEKLQGQLDDSKGALISTQENIQSAKTIHADLLTEIEKTKEELSAHEKELADREKRLKEEEASAQLLEDKRKELEKAIEKHAEQIAALKTQLSGSEGTALAPVDSEATIVRSVLAGYAKKPEDKEVQESLQKLVGFKVSVLEDIVKKDDLGYRTWFRDRAGRIFGYLQQTDEGPRNYIKVLNNFRTITRVWSRLSNVFVRIPKAENWYESWLCDVVATQNRLMATYSNRDQQEWTQIELFGERSGKKATAKPIVYTKDVVSFKVITSGKLRMLFPKQYQKWKRLRDSYGRPGLILKMIERSDNFNANEIVGLQSSALPKNLRATIVNIMNAAVSKNPGTVERHLDAGAINRNRMGEIAAIALRNPRIEDVADRSYVDRGKNEVSRWFVTLRYETLRYEAVRRTRRGPPTATMTFSEASGAWTLISWKR